MKWTIYRETRDGNEAPAARPFTGTREEVQREVTELTDDKYIAWAVRESPPAR